MTRNFTRYSAAMCVTMLYGCNLFAPVDPLPPAFSTVEVVDIKRNEITVSGTIQKPDSRMTGRKRKAAK